MNKAVSYLGRYATSQRRLRKILNHFAFRKLGDHDSDKVATAINATLKRCKKLGYLDDDAFAQMQARSHRQLGRSQLGIRQRLRQHGLNEQVINAAIDVVDQHSVNGELLAACLFARRRRLGPFDSQNNHDKNAGQTIVQRQQRQLGSMVRAGFNIEISRTVIGLEDVAAATLLIDQLKQGEDPAI